MTLMSDMMAEVTLCHFIPLRRGDYIEIMKRAGVPGGQYGRDFIALIGHCVDLEPMPIEGAQAAYEALDKGDARAARSLVEGFYGAGCISRWFSAEEAA